MAQRPSGARTRAVLVEKSTRAGACWSASQHRSGTASRQCGLQPHLYVCTGSRGLDPAPDPLGSPCAGRLSPLLRTLLKPRFPHPDATHASRYASWARSVGTWPGPSVLVPLCPSVLWANSTPPSSPFTARGPARRPPAGGRCPRAGPSRWPRPSYSPRPVAAASSRESHTHLLRPSRLATL